MTSRFFLNRLRLSLLWFALLVAIFSTLVAWFLGTAIANLRDLALAAVPAMFLCSVLFWWLLIVLPQRVTIVRGALAGILSVVLALFLMWIIWGLISGELFQSGHRLTTTLFLGLVTMIAVSISPLGWGLMAIGGSSGGVFAFFLRRWALNSLSREYMRN